MPLTDAQLDRAIGALLGTAVGDALGVPYEFESRPRLRPDQSAEMLGGGLGNFAPGQWSDDTSMAMAIALAGADWPLTSPAALDAVARNFLHWYDGRPPDIGIQTRHVLHSAKTLLAQGNLDVSEALTTSASSYTAENPHSAGNGALMRTAPVALSQLDDRDATAQTARDIARLTHADPLAVDSCVLWSEAIRVAVLEDRIDVVGGLDLLPADRRSEWAARLDAALHSDPNSFTPNGFTVTALQAATAAITQTPESDTDPALHLQQALHTAIRIGNDTDTVAAIAGGLLGARWGASAVPVEWRAKVHGWPTNDGSWADAAVLEKVALAMVERRGLE